MATVADNLITRFSLEDDFSAKAGKVQASAKGVASSVTKAQAAGDGLKAGMSSVASSVAAVGVAIAGVSASIFGVTSGIMGLSTAASEFDRLTKSLEAVEGSAVAAGAAMKDLQQLARAPGIGFEEAVRGYTQLRNAGVEKDFAEAIIREIANSNARAGGNKETFARALIAASQIANKPFLQGEELLQFSEAGIPAQKYLRQAFGTADTEELKKQGITARAALAAITIEMAKQERVGGSLANTYDNIGDAVKYMTVQAGQGVNEGLRPIAEEIGRIADIAIAGGVFRSIGDDIANIFNVDTGKFEDFFINMIAAFKTGIQLAGWIIEALKPLFPWLGTGGAIGMALDSTFQANRNEVAMEFGLGEKRLKKGGTDSNVKGYLAGIEKIATERADATKAIEQNTRETAVNTKSLNDMFNSRILGGGAIGGAALSPVKIQQAIGGNLPHGASEAEKTVLRGLRMMALEMTGLYSDIRRNQQGRAPGFG